MIKTSLIEILRSFSSEEIQRFKDFVSSPYHNKIKNLEKLFLIIKNYSPGFSDPGLEKEKVWRKLFQDKKYNYGIMKNLIHELTKLAEEFIVLEYSSNNELKKYYELIDVLYERKILKTFISKMNTMDKIMAKHFLKNDINTIEEEFFIMFNMYGVKLSSAHLLREKININKDSKKIFELMISCFLIYVYKLYCNLTVFKETGKNKSQNKNIMEEFLKILGEKEIMKIFDFKGDLSDDYLKIMNAYFKMYKTIDRTDFESYTELKKSVFDIDGIVKGQYLFDLFINLNNSLARLKSGSADLAKEYFEIYNLSIKNNCFLEANETLSESIFLKHTLFAFSLKDLKEIEDFTNKFIGSIHEHSRGDCFNFSMANINFLNSDYTASLQSLSKITSKLPVFKLVLKDLQIMNYYELNDYESFLYVMDSYKHYINYKNNPDILKKYGYGFCLMVKNLFELRNNPDEYKLANISKEEFTCLSTCKNWYKEKLYELQGNK